MATVRPEVDQPVSRARSAFGYLWSASIVSSVGDGAYLVAAPLLAALLTNSPIGVAVVSAATAAPWLLVGFWSGAIVDRFPRRLVMVIADLVRAVGLTVIAVLVASGHATIAALAGASFLVVAGKSFHDAAAQALVPHVVGRSQDALTRANGRLFAGETVSQTVAGPPLGGATFGVAPWLPFALDAVSFAGSAALLGRVPAPPPPERQDGQSLGAAVREGFQYLFRRRELVALALCLGAFNLAYNLAYATIVLFAKHTLHVSNFGFALLVSVGALGSAVTGWLAPALVRRLTTKGAVVAALLVQALGWLAVAATSSVWIVGAALLVLGTSTTLVTVAAVSARQQIVPDYLLGRVVSAFRLLGNGAAPVGSVLGGLVADGYGLRAPLVLAPIVIAASLALFAAPLFNRPRPASGQA
ncbi:MFS transporter [Rugosimonospora acidiphila]|uniref:MFS transporter n=1 Tax=Rugosimonospora acidiphila TaxID=556531 RepID=A0ABP9RFV8_9ACTN